VTATRFPSVPLADDPELAEHALWNDEIAEDLERMDEEGLTLAHLEGGESCPCDLAIVLRGSACPCGEMKVGPL
jgi:hypothetical protein